jgi:WD40 repeat protein
LARARDLLRGRLVRRGLAPAGMVGAVLLDQGTRAGVPATLHQATVVGALRGATTAGLAPIAYRLLRNAFLLRSKITAATALTLALLAGGAALVVGSVPAVQPSERSAPSPIATAPSGPPPGRRPAYPLPDHARARLGTLEFFAKGPGLDYPSEFGQVAHSGDGKFLVTSIGTNACIWDATTGRLLHTIADVSGEPTLAPDGSTLAGFDADHRLTLWDPATGQVRRRWHPVQGEIYQGLTFSPDGRTLAACSGKPGGIGHTCEFLTLWDLTRRTEYRRRLRVDLSYGSSFRFSGDGEALVVLEEVFRQPPEEGFPTPPIREHIRLRQIDIVTGQERRQLELPGELIGPFAFSPNGTLLASQASDATIRVLDVATGQERVPKLRHDQISWDQTTSLAFSPDGSILAVGGLRGAPTATSPSPIHLWDLASGKELHHFPAHRNLVRSLSFAPDGQTLASVGQEPVIRLWDVATGREKIPHVGHERSIWCLAVSPTDGTVYTGGSDRTIRRWDPDSGRELGIVARLDLPACTMAPSSDGTTLVVGTYRSAGLWNVSDRREVRHLADQNIGYWSCVAYSPDGRTVAADGRVWDVATGKVLLTLRGPIPGPETNPLNIGTATLPNPGYGPKPQPEPRLLGDCPIAYTPDGKQIITVQREGIQVWDIASGRSVRWAVRTKRISSHGYGHQTAFSTDRRLVATCGEAGVSDPAKIDRTIHIWDLTAGQEIRTLHAAPGSAFNAVAFSADGRLLASGSWSNDRSRGGTVSVWDVATGRELRRFSGHRESVNVVAFTPDGRSVVSGSDDATALVWDIDDL